MLSIERVRELLNDPAISDEEAKIIRDEMYTLVEIIFEKWQQDGQPSKVEAKSDSK